MKNNTIKYTEKDLQIKEWLIGLAKIQYDHGDDFYAYKSKNGKWHFGSSNDEPMKFGNGYENILPEGMVEIIYDQAHKQ